jgi:translocon-associated protein subunit beta
MANSIAMSLISVLLIAALFSSTIATSDSPFIVAHKKATLNRLKSGAERVSVSIDIFNEGSATAYDVSLTDDSWSKDIFEVVSGNTSMSWERLDAGYHRSHTFELESKVQTVFYGAPAVITFRIPTKSALQEAFSTAIMPLEILAERPPEKKFEWAQRLLAKYGSLISVISIVVLFIYLVASPTSKSNAAKGSKKKR